MVHVGQKSLKAVLVIGSGQHVVKALKRIRHSITQKGRATVVRYRVSSKTHDLHKLQARV